MPPQNSEHYHVPFGNYANFVNHSGVAAIKIQQFFQNSSSTCGIFATSRSSLSAPVRVHVDVRNGYGTARGVGAAPRRRRSNQAIFDREFQFREWHASAETKKLLTENMTPEEMILYIFILRCIILLLLFCRDYYFGGNSNKSHHGNRPPWDLL